MANPSMRNAVVTGASAGLGRELVRQLARDRGMTVLATARKLDRLEELAAEFPEGRVLVEAGDIADPAFRGHLWARAERMPGGVDLLVNNAGIGHYAEFEEQDFVEVEKILAVNVVALMDLTARALRHMKARGSGQIMQVSSILGFMGLPYSSAYVASKHAVNGLVASLRYELAGTGVRVWSACPARTLSEFNRVALADPASTGRLPRGEPTEVVVRGMLRGLDQRGAFVFPTRRAWAMVKLALWLAWPFDAFMTAWSAGHFRREIEEAGGRLRRRDVHSDGAPPPTPSAP